MWLNTSKWTSWIRSSKLIFTIYYVAVLSSQLQALHFWDIVISLMRSNRLGKKSWFWEKGSYKVWESGQSIGIQYKIWKSTILTWKLNLQLNYVLQATQRVSIGDFKNMWIVFNIDLGTISLRYFDFVPL